MEDILIPVAISSGFALTGGALCYVLTRYGKITISLILLGLLAALFLWLWLQARALIGWDALGYALGAILFAAPAFGGGLLGTLIAHYRRNRAQDRPTP